MVVWHRGGGMVTKGKEGEKKAWEEEESKQGERMDTCTEVSTGIKASVQGVSGMGSQFVTILSF